MLQFQDISFLYGLALLLPLVGLLLYVLNWKQKTRKLLGDERLVNQLTISYSHKKYLFKTISILISIALLLVAAANFRKPIAGKGTAASGIDVIIALDVSNSMLAEDEKPNRLGKAKELIYQLCQQLQNDRIGLVVFAGHAFLQMPLTGDAAATKMFVSNANPSLVNLQGTDIGSALTLCSNSLNTKEKKYKAAILITDGEDQDDKALEAAKTIAEKGVIVHTVGIGSAEGSTITEPGTNEYKRDINGQTVITKLNKALLEQIAIATGGTYHQLDNTTNVSADLAEILNGMEKKAILNPGGYVNYKSYAFIFLGVAVLMLLIESFISEQKAKPRSKVALVALVPLLLIAVPGFSQTNTENILKGNELYRKGDYKGAQAAYEKVLGEDTKNTAAAFNNGNSLYRQQQFAEAAKQMEALANSTNDPLLQAKALYNKGVAEAKQQQMEAALQSFKKSLMLNNNDEATRENLQMVINELKKQNQQKNQQQQPKRNQQKEQNKPMNKKQAEQQLNMLREEEKRLQQEVQQKKANPDMKAEKDW
ncbi:VWA domain-containing protein [Parasediminibacterium sp. JCM 36343]|uniref:VWA domain-containing protein n=1 Tax=Parasediminibacterium sp. JCM 36343 TaxID=3374279 RepID=UPI00397BEC10